MRTGPRTGERSCPLVGHPTARSPAAVSPSPVPQRLDPATLDHPGSALNRAAAAVRQADPFSCRTEWGFSFHEVMAPKRELVLFGWRDSMLALAERRAPNGGRWFEPLDSGWKFGCPLLGEDAVELLCLFLEALAEARTPHAVLLSGLAPGGRLVRQVLRQAGGHWEFVHREPTVLQSASLEGGLDGWLSRRSGHFRRRLLHSVRRAAALGVHYERCVPRTEQEAHATYERMVAVELTSWKGIGHCGMAEGQSLPYYRAMLRRLAVGGNGRVVFARAGDRDIGFIFGGMAGAHYRGQQFSYAEDWSRHSIGNCLQYEQLRWLGEEGAQCYDMGPKMDYKQHWTEIEQVIEARVLRPR